MQVIVVASEKYYHCLSPFMYLWEKYAQLSDGDFPLFDVIVCGFGQVEFAYDHLCRFYGLGRQKDWPVSRWSDKLIKILDEVAEEQFILMLEDYWLTRSVDIRAIWMLFDYAKQFNNVLKIDLTHDRLYINGGSTYLYGANTYNYCGYLDLLKSPPDTPYQMSLWAGIWNRDQMKRVLIPGETAQDIEINGTRRVSDDQLVLGTRQGPLLHGNIYQSRNNGKPVYKDDYWEINPTDMEYMKAQGWL